MEYVKLGNSPLTVSRLCVGCMSFGDPASRMHAWTLDPAESEEIVKHALSLGINFFDTANTYSAGTSEEYLGRAIRSNVPRDQVILASKVYFNEGHLSREAILREIDGTLQRLGTDYLDLYIIHRFDADTPVEETMEALDSLLPGADVVAMSLPGNPSTYHILNRERIALLSPGTIVLNAGRGTAIDTDALCEALYAGKIAGAALDVTDPEPLPADHPLWKAPGAVITPHISGGYALPETLQKIAEIFAENLKRYQSGEPLMNVVDPETGYSSGK